MVAMKPKQLVSTNRGAKPFPGAYSALNANEDDFRPGDSSQDLEMTMSGSVDPTAPIPTTRFPLNTTAPQASHFALPLGAHFQLP